MSETDDKALVAQILSSYLSNNTVAANDRKRHGDHTYQIARRTIAFWAGYQCAGYRREE